MAENQQAMDLDALLQEALSESAAEDSTTTDVTSSGADDAPQIESASRSSYSTKAESGA